MASRKSNGDGAGRQEQRKARRSPNTSSSAEVQLGAQGRLTSTPEQPVLTPRSSKVPAQDSDFLTTGQGVRVADTDNSLKAGVRGPTVMDDFHLREKLTSTTSASPSAWCTPVAWLVLEARSPTPAHRSATDASSKR